MDKMKLILKVFSLFFIVLFFVGCETTKPTVNVHGEKPLIDTSKVISDGKKQIEKKIRTVPNFPKLETFNVFVLVRTLREPNITSVSLINIP